LSRLHVWTVAFLAGCGGAQHPVGVNAEGPLAGFKVLELPRTEIDLGAVWIDGVGPQSVGLGARELVTVGSLSRGTIVSHGAFSAGVAVGLGNWFGGTATASTTTSARVTIEEASIVRVANASTLPHVAGTRYLWEAVRAERFSIEDATKSSAELAMRTHALLPSAQVSAIGEHSLAIQARNVFVAYRVISFVAGEEELAADVTWNGSGASGKIGKDYVLEFASLSATELAENPEASGKPFTGSGSNWQQPTMAQARCTRKLRLVSHAELDSLGNPLVRQWRFSCWDLAGNEEVSPRRIQLPGRSSSRGIIADALEIKAYDDDTQDGELRVKAWIRLWRSEFQTVTLMNPSAPGY
jgi:hypothetical protein